MAADDGVRRELRRLLVSVGRLPSNIRGRATDVYGAVSDAMLRKLIDLLRPLFEIALAQAVEDDAAYFAGIRRFFLEAQAAYTLDELAALWRVCVEDVREVLTDEIADWEKSQPDGLDAFRVVWAEALRTTLSYNFFRPIDVERALGADFGRVHAESWHTVPLVIHVPRFMVDVLMFDGITSNRTPSARIEQYLLDLFPLDHRREFAAALRRERSDSQARAESDV